MRVLAEQDAVDDHAAAAVGDLLARLISLRQLSVSVARALAEGHSPVNEAALVKDLGTRFEQESVELAADLFSYVEPIRRAALRSPHWWSRPGCTRRCSRCAAGPTRCCAAWWPKEWGCVS